MPAFFNTFMGVKTDLQLSASGQNLARLTHSEDRAQTDLAERTPVQKHTHTSAPRAGFPVMSYESQWHQDDVVTSHNSVDETVQWKAGEGLYVRMNEDVALTGGYAYHSAEDTDFGGYHVDYQGHELRLGVKITLPYDE